MKIKKYVILGLTALFLLFFTLPVLAASSDFLPQATDFYNRYCNMRRIPSVFGISCYLYEKTQELEGDINSLQSEVEDLGEENVSQNEKISELEERIKALEATPTPTLTPTPISTPTPTPDLTPFEVQFSVVSAIDFDKGTAQANKLIKLCTYGSSAYGAYVPLNGNINEILCMTPELWGAQLLWMRVESYYGEVKIYGNFPTLPTYIVSDNSWKFSLTEVSGWFGLDYDDSAWTNSVAPSGGQCDPNVIGLLINEHGALPMSYESTPWSIGYFRKIFYLPASPSSGTVRVVLDDDGDLYINGNLVISDHDGHVAGISQADVSSYLESGKNVLALKVIDSAGGCQHAQVELEILVSE